MEFETLKLRKEEKPNEVRFDECLGVDDKWADSVVNYAGFVIKKLVTASHCWEYFVAEPESSKGFFHKLLRNKKK